MLEHILVSFALLCMARWMPSLPDPIAGRDRSSGIIQKKMLRDQSERGMELNMVFLT
jgi:hypothetical protein